MRRMFLALFLCTGIAAAQAQPPTIDTAAIEQTALAELSATKTPGAAIGIVYAGRLIFAKGFGTANVETGAPITPETLFRLGSTTKVLTASAVVSLASAGKIDLKETVGKYIHGLHPSIAQLTVDQILSHTSGLKDEAVMNGRHDDAALGDEIRTWIQTGCSLHRGASTRIPIRATGSPDTSPKWSRVRRMPM